MNAEQVVSALIGAFFGAAGWLLVGLYMQRRLHQRAARNAARAVYFELEVNRINVEVALRHGVFQPLSRASFERLLPELATWLSADELQTLTRAYMAHAGHQQVQADQSVPPAVRQALLQRIATEQQTAAAVLSRRAFSVAERERMSAAEGRGEARSVSAGVGTVLDG